MLLQLAGSGHAEAPALRRSIAAIALRERNEAAPPLASIAAYAAALASRTVCITLLAGSGSRWSASLEAARRRPAAAGEEDWRSRGRGYDIARPRGLFPVRDFLRGEGRASERLLPIAAYALAALHGLGRHLIVVRGWEREIDEEILLPLGIARSDRDYFTQESSGGKPRGHGDAVWQCRALWKGAEYVLANFGGDASSRRTARSSLLALDALAAGGAPVDLLMPAAPVQEAAYPISLDDAGLPRSFGHAKLQGSGGETGGRAASPPDGPSYTNVGLRLYRADALLEAVERLRREHWSAERGYAIPGNDPEGGEFALDNVDAELAAARRARVLAFARSQELRPAKCLEDIPAFEEAAADVAAEDALSEEGVPV